MSSKSKYSKDDFIRYIAASVDSDSSDTQKAREFLESEGLNVDLIVSDGLKRIRKMQLEIQAQKTKDGMREIDSIRDKAALLVEKLLSSPTFSFLNFIKQENIAVSFRNVEQIEAEDIREILIKHFALKLLDDESQNPNGA